MDAFKEVINPILPILNNLASTDGRIVAALVTILAGFIAWIYREVTYKPLQDSRETFYRHAEKRILVLSEIRNILMILRGNRKEVSAKDKLKEILQSEEIGYLDETMNYDLIEIAYGSFDENLLWKVQGEIKDELITLLGQIEKENNHFLDQARQSILGRVLQFLVFTIKIILISGILLVALFYFVTFIIFLGWGWKIAVIILTILLVLILNSRWFRHYCNDKYEHISRTLKKGK